jgi:hypothetical protein
VEAGLEETHCHLSFDQVEQVLGVTPPVRDRLIKEGLLQADGIGITGWQGFLEEYAWEYQAGRLLGLRLPAFRKWVLGGRVTPVLVIGQAALFRRADLAPFEPRNRATTKEAARLLGLSHPQQVQRKYIRPGLLRPIAGPGVDFGADLIFDRSDVMRLASTANLIDQVEPSISDVSRDTCACVSTEEAAALLGMSIGAFQRAYRSTNILVPVARERGGRSNLFQRTAVERLALRRSGQLLSAEGSGVNHRL